VSEWPQTHPSREVETPDGQTIHVDEGIWPLIQAIWVRGWTTNGSCQNLGEAIRATQPDKTTLAALRMDKAWLKLPNEHADQFLSTAARDPELRELIRPILDQADHWVSYSYRGANGLYANTQIYLPTAHIPRVVAQLT
jgi:hypothetical protein